MQLCALHRRCIDKVALLKGLELSEIEAMASDADPEALAAGAIIRGAVDKAQRSIDGEDQVAVEEEEVVVKPAWFLTDMQAGLAITSSGKTEDRTDELCTALNPRICKYFTSLGECSLGNEYECHHGKHIKPVIDGPVYMGGAAEEADEDTVVEFAPVTELEDPVRPNICIISLL